MKGLIINHNTRYIDKLVELFNCDVMNYTDFDIEKVEQYDYVILSGGPIDISKETDIKTEKDWLRETNKPILGVCLGLQILCLVYDETLDYKELEHNRKIFDSVLFENFDYNMFYNHSYYFNKIPENFIGEVKDNILIWMRHKTKTILAFQGHPEMSEDGEKIREYFLNMIKKAS
jgi:anthranilate/para-aminobenzoate synthase component II